MRIKTLRPIVRQFRLLAAPVLIFAIVVALTVGLQRVSASLIRVDLDQAANETCYKVILLIQSRLNERMGSIRKIADFVATDRELEESEFQELARIAIRDAPEIAAIAVSDEAGHPIWSRSPALDPAEVSEICRAPEMAPAIEETLLTGGAYAVTRRIPIPGQGWGFAVVAPYRKADGGFGLVVGVFAHARLMDSMLFPQIVGDFGIELKQSDNQVFQSFRLSAGSRPPLSQTGGPIHSVEDFFFVGPQVWKVRIETTAVGAGATPLGFASFAILGLGGSLGLLIAGYVYTQQRRASRFQTEAWVSRSRLATTGLNLAQIQENLDLILNNVDDCIILYDEEFAPVQANAAFKKRFRDALGSGGFAPTSAEHHRAMAARFGDEARYRALLDSLEDSPERFLGDRLEARDADGSPLHFQRRGAAALRPDGARRGYLLIYRDVTASIGAEKMKEDFLSSVTHDLRTPLASIKGFAETMLRDPDMPAEIRAEFTTIVRDEATRLENMIEDLLDVRRMEEGRIDLAPETYSPRAVVEDAVRSMRPIFEANGQRVEVEWNGAPGEPPLGDVAMLGRAVRNVLGNAVKYSPQGGIIRIVGWEWPDRVALEISDRGPGIPPEDLPHVFEKFYRGGRHVRRVKGVGLGLAIVRHIVESHGGAATAHSDGTNGATIRISLPRRWDMGTAAPAARAPETPRPAGPAEDFAETETPEEEHAAR